MMKLMIEDVAAPLAGALTDPAILCRPYRPPTCRQDATPVQHRWGGSRKTKPRAALRELPGRDLGQGPLVKASLGGLRPARNTNPMTISRTLFKAALLATFHFSLPHSSLSAQGPTDPLSLAEAIAWGVDNNLSVAGQRLNAEVAARDNNFVTAGRRPLVQATLALNNGVQTQDNPASFINGSFYNGNATAGLQANYTLFNGYRVRFDKRRLGQLETIANEQVEQLIETAVYEVGRAYYDAQLAEAQAALARQVRGFSQDRLAFQELRREYGQGRSVELLQARTAYLSDSVRVEQARLRVDNALRALYLALDAGPDEFAGRGLADTLLFDPRDWNVETVAAALDSSVNLRLLRRERALALTQTEIARTAFQPTVSLSAGLNYTRNAFDFFGTIPARNAEPGAPAQETPLQFGSSSGLTTGITAAYTLWDAGLRRRQLDNAVTRERLADVTLSNARRDADTRARTLVATYDSQRELLELQEALIDNARANLALADEQLAAGAINSFDYRQLELDYLNAVQGRIQATYDLLLTDLELRRATGRLVE